MSEMPSIIFEDVFVFFELTYPNTIYLYLTLISQYYIDLMLFLTCSEAADRSEEEFSEASVSDDEGFFNKSLLKARGISVLLHRLFKAEKEQLPPLYKMVASFAVNVLTNAYVNLSHRFLIAR